MAGYFTIPQLQALANGSASQYGVPSSLFQQLITGESGWNPNAVSSTGALGLGQVLPSTANAPGYGVGSYGGDLTDPQGNLDFSANYLSALYGQTGSWVDAINRYTGGQAPASTIAAAMAADGSGSGGFTNAPGFADNPLNYDPTTGIVTPNSGAAGAGLGDPGSAAGQGVLFLSGVVGYLQQGGLILLGVLVIVVGLWMLKDKV